MSQPPHEGPFEQTQPVAPAGVPPYGAVPPPAGFPAAGQPGVPRDRLAVSLTWDAVALVIAAALVGLLLATSHGVHAADIVRPLGSLGLIAAGLALSLRAGAPNLAVGAIAATTGVIGAHLAAGGWSLLTAMVVAVALATAGGLLAGLVTGGLSVPAWAVTLAGAFAATGAAEVISANTTIAVHVSGSYPASQWLAAFIVASVGGGLLWLVPAIRRAFSRSRDQADPGQWAGLGALLGAVAGLAGSSLLAGLGGVSLAAYDGAASASDGSSLTLAALAAALIGGVSVFGRRAGVLGTALGVVIVQVLQLLMAVHNVSVGWVSLAYAGLAVIGLGVSRIVESATQALS